MIAALFVADGGCYCGREDVDPWSEQRDARLYSGPHRVVAHPPCQRWGRYWHGGPSVRVRKIKGDDGGCFASALASVRAWGGVLEHPAYSHAWARYGLIDPPHTGGWIMADAGGGWTCHVEQGHYGHRARKATWLYAFDAALPSLRWGPSVATVRLDEGCHSAAERAQRTRSRQASEASERGERGEASEARVSTERMGRTERMATPIAFRNLLLAIAAPTAVAKAHDGAP